MAWYATHGGTRAHRTSTRSNGQSSASIAARARSCSRASIATGREAATISRSRAPSPSAVAVPVIASGGAGSAHHVRDVVVSGCADAALVAGILHDGVTTVRDIKDLLARERISVRRVA